MANIKKGKSLKNTVKTIANKATKFNPEVLKTSEQLVDNTLVTGDKVQDIMEKALQNGVAIFGKQQELTIDTIETIVGQYRNTNDRFKQLIGWNKKGTILQLPFKKQTQQAIATAKSKVQEVIDKADTLLPKVPTKKANPVKSSKRKVAKKVKAVKATTKKDLTIIEGIGPKIASILQKAGIRSFEQLAKTDVSKLQAILAKAGGRYKSHDPSSWAQQAELAAAGKWEVLTVWKKRLKGGKSASTSRVVVL